MNDTPTALGGGAAPNVVDLMHGSLARTPMTIALVGINVAVFGTMTWPL